MTTTSKTIDLGVSRSVRPRPRRSGGAARPRSWQRCRPRATSDPPRSGSCRQSASHHGRPDRRGLGRRPIGLLEPHGEGHPVLLSGTGRHAEHKRNSAIGCGPSFGVGSADMRPPLRAMPRWAKVAVLVCLICASGFGNPDGSQTTTAMAKSSAGSPGRSCYWVKGERKWCLGPGWGTAKTRSRSTASSVRCVGEGRRPARGTPRRTSSS
jgi:hypothetical protein